MLCYNELIWFPKKGDTKEVLMGQQWWRQRVFFYTDDWNMETDFRLSLSYNVQRLSLLMISDRPYKTFILCRTKLVRFTITNVSTLVYCFWNSTVWRILCEGLSCFSHLTRKYQTRVEKFGGVKRSSLLWQWVSYAWKVLRHFMSFLCLEKNAFNPFNWPPPGATFIKLFSSSEIS